VRKPKVDELFVAAVEGWLEDLSHLSPKQARHQIDCVFWAQQQWGTGFRFYTEMKHVATTVITAIVEGKPYKRMATLRTGRAAERCKLPEDMLRKCRDSYKKRATTGRKVGKKYALKPSEMGKLRGKGKL